MHRFIASITIALSTSAALATPFATSVVSYDAGTNAIAGYTDATSALGAAERFTGEGVFPSGVTPFNPAFGTDELVSVGSGGHLTLGFDRAITNSASHAFGIDLIVFSNSGFVDTSWTDSDPTNDGSGLVGNTPTLFGAGGEATIEVSSDGIHWFTAAVTTLDLFPTLGYSDFTDATPFSHGTVQSDFTRAIDPSIALNDLAGISFSDIVALYNGSGGGVGIDISSTGLTSASFVRFTNNSGEAFEIDAVSVVPSPSTLALLTLGVCAVNQRKR
ncbi:MAG: hypothetical protein KC996_06370 [Phycisphaerales bacterium]|nr:hypothetical protein [Phycisphaerales bacterium]